MPPEDPDDLVGIPVRPPGRVSTEFRAAPRSSTAEIGGRNAADEAIPLGNPTSVTAVSPEAQSRRDAERYREDADQVLRKVLQADAERTNGILRRTCRRLFTTAVAVVAGFGGLLLCTQLIQAIQILTTWPSWWQGIGWVALVACFLLVLWSLGRLIWFFVRFRRNRPLTRRLLDEREHLRELGSHVHAAAREQLSTFMREYPLDQADQRGFLRRWGMPESEFEMMKRKRSDLLGAGNLQDSKAWQESFETCFLKPLDAAAGKIIRDNALLTAAKTAICPFALLDMAVVVYRGTSMLGSLCRVYQLRAGPLDMLYLFALVMGQAFFAGEVEEHGEEIASSLTEAVPIALHGVGISALDWVPGMPPGLGKLAGKAGQGLANGLLLKRIGRSACELLRPLRAV
ncbi:MAG TPA: YcjF family protein [Pirellulales bacterium]|nr:YcjF family protein [Pirellulales bacterium]